MRRVSGIVLAVTIGATLVGSVGCSSDDNDRDYGSRRPARANENFSDRDGDGTRDGLEDRNRDGVRDGEQNGGANSRRERSRDRDIYR